MSFERRIIAVNFKLSPNTSNTFNAAGNTSLSVRGLRTRATIQSTLGGPNPFMSQLTLQIWGMRNEDMAAMSTLGLTTGIYSDTGANAQTQISVQAGTANGMSTVFTGMILDANVDYNQQPRVPLTIYASATAGLQFGQAAPSSQSGSVSVATMLQAICATVGIKLVNNGVTAQLANHCVGGSVFNQISDICLASGTQWGINSDGTTLTIWPAGSFIDSSDPIAVVPGEGMVGYPMYSAQGINIQTEYNPQISYGKQVTVQSSVPIPGPNSPYATQKQAGNPNAPTGMTGTFYVNDVVHDISGNLPDGPWFTYAKLGTTSTRVFG